MCIKISIVITLFRINRVKCVTTILIRRDSMLDRIHSFLYLPLIERFRRDDVNTIACRVLDLRRAKSETWRCREEKSSEAVTQSLLLTPVKFGRRPSRTNRRSKTPFVTLPGLVIRITLIISVFSITKNNESLLLSEHLIMYVQRKSYA